MRLKIVSVCAVVFLVFFGLQVVLRSLEPHPPGRIAASAGQDASRNHLASLASLASLAAGAVVFAVFPKRRAARPGASSSTVRTIAASAESTVCCPHCDQQMRRILIAGGEHRGRTVWLCPQSPDCEIRPLARQRSSIFSAREAG